MKNQITSRIVKLTFALMFVLLASSCSDDNETLDAAALAKENTGSEISAKGVGSTVLSFTSSIAYISTVCIGEEQTFTLSGWNGTQELNVKIYDAITDKWITIDSFNGAKFLSSKSLSYTFLSTGTFTLEYQVSGNPADGGTKGFIKFTITVEDCSRIVEDGCSMSQGFWFSSKESVWSYVTVGGKEYTKAEGLAIWKSSNDGGIENAKKGFLQVAAY